MLSVIVPIGGFPNGSKQIRMWLNHSIGPEVEVILINDSVDISTEREIDSIVKSAPTVDISVIASMARNPGGARNLGLDNAKGEWICFWDSDDVGLINVTLEAINQARQESAELIIGKYRTISLNTKTEVTQETESAYPALSGIYLNPGLWRIVFKRNLTNMKRFPNLRMGEDQVFAFMILQKAKRIFLADVAIYHYYNYPGLQLTKTKSAMDDLYLALKLTSNLYRSQTSAYLQTSILRQSISVIKYCRVEYKLRALSNLMKLSLHQPQFLFSIPKSLLIIVRQT